jgi:uncharacterized repeat protein (TIGR02543 family)
MTTTQQFTNGGRLARTAMLFAGALLAAATGSAQNAVVGALGNFDAANFEGKDAHGMEIQIEGIGVGDLTPSWCGNKYNCPTIVPYATGVYVRYMSPYDSVNQAWLATTVPHTPGTAFAGTCYMGTATYATAGCDHFGVHLAYTAAANAAVTTAYRWMFEDPNNPGTLIASTNNIFVPTPVYTFVPPAVPTNPPVLVAEIQTPDPPPPPPALPPQFGDATWMKVYKTDMNREVALDELISTNPIVPQSPLQIETEWVLMQPAPPAAPGDNRKRRNRQSNSGGVSAGTRAVLRRYETYAYTGAYDPLTHEARCADGTCTAPQAGELGDMLVAQMVAANVSVPGLTVTITGSGTVSSADKVISCGSHCAATYAAGTVVTLTAKAGSNSTFGGWTGACTGTSLTCTVTITDALTTNATFTAAPAGGGGGGGGGGSTTTQFTLQIGRSNTGTVTSDVTGINCGSTCSAKFNSGTVVTLTATPPAGKTFVSWGGACSGTQNTCAVTMSTNLSVQANFSK